MGNNVRSEICLAPDRVLARMRYAHERLGFRALRQRGSHVVLRKGECGCVVPRHRTLAVGTLRSILKQAGLSADEFNAAL